MNARTLIEAETPKKTFKAMPRQVPMMEVGEEVLRATGDTREIIGATLGALKALDRKAFFDEMDSDLEAYLRGEDPPEFDPEFYCYERLFPHMDRYCPPFSYYGSYEADGSIGCWPYQDDAMEEQADQGKLTIVNGHQNPEGAEAALNGDYTGIETRYVLVYALKTTLVDTQAGKTVWEW